MSDSGTASPDADRDTVHLRCGSDIQQALRAAGLQGRFLEFADPYCQGPVIAGSGFLDRRARFIAGAYGIELKAVRLRQRAEEEALAQAWESARVVLWFEHDSYDQLILARVLHSLDHADALAQGELICIDRFPGVDRFFGLGQLSPHQLRSLWDQRVPITADHRALGSAVWDALCDASPLPLHEIASRGTPAIPPMAAALRRHLQELPWTRDGLSLTQRLSLQALQAGQQTAAGLFRTLHSRLEPLPYLGDQMYWHELAQMCAAESPPLCVESGTALRPWPERRLALTDTGQALLAAQADWRSCGPVARWVGGVSAAGAEPGWQWSADDESPVQA